MAALATVADLEARAGRAFSVDEVTRAEALLDGASARVRAYTGQQFDQDTTTDRLRVRNGRIRLPQRPVTAVSVIADTDGNDVAFTWYAGDLIDVGWSSRADREPYTYSTRWLDVTYTHGYATIPDDVVEVVCQMVLRAFGVDPEATGLSQESIGSYSYSVGTTAASGSVGLLGDERAALDVYRRVGGTIRTA